MPFRRVFPERQMKMALYFPYFSLNGWVGLLFDNFSVRIVDNPSFSTGPFKPGTLLERVCGEPFDAKYYVAYLTKKMLGGSGNGGSIVV